MNVVIFLLILSWISDFFLARWVFRLIQAKREIQYNCENSLVLKDNRIDTLEKELYRSGVRETVRAEDHEDRVKGYKAIAAIQALPEVYRIQTDATEIYKEKYRLEIQVEALSNRNDELEEVLTRNKTTFDSLNEKHNGLIRRYNIVYDEVLMLRAKHIHLEKSSFKSSEQAARGGRTGGEQGAHIPFEVVRNGARKAETALKAAYSPDPSHEIANFSEKREELVYQGDKDFWFREVYEDSDHQNFTGFVEIVSRANNNIIGKFHIDSLQPGKPLKIDSPKKNIYALLCGLHSFDCECNNVILTSQPGAKTCRKPGHKDRYRVLKQKHNAVIPAEIA